MKKIWKIVLSVVVVLVVAAAAIVVWQWDNISALYMGVMYSDETIERKIEENKQKLAEQLKKENILDQKIIDGFSKEDEEKLAKGEISVEEAIENLFGEGKQSDTQNGNESSDTNANNSSKENTNGQNENNQSPGKNNQQSNDNQSGKADGSSSQKNGSSDGQSGKTGTSEKVGPKQEGTDSAQNQATSNQQPNNNTSEDAGSAQQKLIKDAVQEMYVLKAEFISRLGSIERTGKQMYVALGKDGMTKENKLEIADQLLPQLTAAESECDAKVESVLSKLSSELSAIGADTSVVNTMREQYQNEKKLQKSNMISEYM